jgi:hypothetical protein
MLLVSIEEKNAVKDYTENLEADSFKLFISQKMKDLSVDEIIADRKRGVEYFKKFIKSTGDIEVIDNLYLDAPEDYKPSDYLANDIKAIGNADAVLFLDGWYTASGCLVEFEAAKKFGLPLYFE